MILCVRKLDFGKGLSLQDILLGRAEKVCCAAAVARLAHNAGISNGGPTMYGSSIEN